MNKVIVSLRLGLLGAAAILAACGTAQHTGQSPTPQVAAASAQVQQPRAVVQRAAVGKGLYELVYSPKYNAVFVAAAGGWGEGADSPKVLRLNPETLAVETEIALSRKGFGLALDEGSGHLYVGNTVDASVTLVDLEAGRERGIIQLEQPVVGADGKAAYQRDLRQLAFDPVRKRVYIVAHGMEPPSVLYVIDAASQQVIAQVPGIGPVKAPGILLDAPRNRLYLSNLLGEVLQVDTATLEIVQRWQAGIEQPLNMALDAAGKRLFITDQGAPALTEYLGKVLPDFRPSGKGHRVVVLDADSGAQLAEIATDAEPLQLLLDATRKRLYVTNRGAGTITVYDSDSYARLQTIAAPAHPNTLAMDTVNGILFTTVKNGEDAADTKESVVRVHWQPR